MRSLVWTRAVPKQEKVAFFSEHALIDYWQKDVIQTALNLISKEIKKINDFPSLNWREISTQ